MKRSSINQYISEAAAFFKENGFAMPPYAEWTPEEWQRRGSEADEIRARRLGWDVTDFNSGHFNTLGLTLFTLRNGLLSERKSTKSYAEKIMFVRKNQITPFHYHVEKTEDIINRGGRGGQLVVQFYNSSDKGGLAQSPVEVRCDGIARRIEPGGTFILGPGESVTVQPFLYHKFYAIDSDCLIGEVSTVNDDDTDNYFFDPIPRYPNIIEDEPPTRILCTEYGAIG